MGQRESAYPIWYYRLHFVDERPPSSQISYKPLSKIEVTMAHSKGTYTKQTHDEWKQDDHVKITMQRHKRTVQIL